MEKCTRCKKNKATITFANSMLDWTHGFAKRICQECYDKQMKASEWYKQGYKDGKNAGRHKKSSKN